MRSPIIGKTKSKKKKPYVKFVVIFAAAIMIIAGVGCYVWKQEHRSKVLEIYIFNMSSGNAVFVRTPEDERILIDGGGNSNIIRELTKILPFYTRRIDTLISTNTEGKNVAGLIDVLDRYEVNSIYVPAVTLRSLMLASSTDQIYETFIGHALRASIKVNGVSTGQTMDFDANELHTTTHYADSRANVSGEAIHSIVRFTVLFPVLVGPEISTSSSPNFKYSKASAPELLMKLDFGATSAVLLGDASVKIQKYIASASDSPAPHKNSLTSNILIVSHSALPSNMSAKLVEYTHPDYLVYAKAESTSKLAVTSTANSIATKVGSKTATSTSVKKPIPDPFVYMSPENKLNTKKVGTVHLISDGVNFRVVVGE